MASKILIKILKGSTVVKNSLELGRILSHEAAIRLGLTPSEGFGWLVTTMKKLKDGKVKVTFVKVALNGEPVADGSGAREGLKILAGLKKVARRLARIFRARGWHVPSGLPVVYNDGIFGPDARWHDAIAIHGCPTWLIDELNYIIEQLNGSKGGALVKAILSSNRIADTKSFTKALMADRNLSYKMARRAAARGLTAEYAVKYALEDAGINVYDAGIKSQLDLSGVDKVALVGNGVTLQIKASLVGALKADLKGYAKAGVDAVIVTSRVVTKSQVKALAYLRRKASIYGLKVMTLESVADQVINIAKDNKQIKG